MGTVDKLSSFVLIVFAKLHKVAVQVLDEVVITVDIGLIRTELVTLIVDSLFEVVSFFIDYRWIELTLSISLNVSMAKALGLNDSVVTSLLTVSKLTRSY